MHPVVRRSRKWVRERPFVFLITAQLALLIADAVLDRNDASTFVSAGLLVLFTSAVVIALKSVRMPTRHLAILGGAAVCLRILEYYAHQQAVSLLLYTVWGVFSGAAVLSLIRFTLRQDRVEAFDKLAAVSAAYIEFPQFWSSVFLLIQAGDPHAFHPGPHQHAPLDYQQMLYFAYNVFTTVDISDVLPASRLASITVVLAEIVAQLFVVIFIARLVGFFPGKPHEEKGER